MERILRVWKGYLELGYKEKVREDTKSWDIRRRLEKILRVGISGKCWRMIVINTMSYIIRLSSNKTQSSIE